MPSDNDRVESDAHIAAPSSAAPIYPQVISPNFPLPSPKKCHGDATGNWEFFKQQWCDYEIATGLDKREESVRLATLRSSMGRECRQILLNLNLLEEDKKKIDKCLEALENYFPPSRNLVYERDGLKSDPDKVTAIKNMPKPTTKPEVLTLLGFANYLSKFQPKLSDVSAPLRELITEQSKFTWAKQHNEAFAAIQHLVTQHPVLKFYSIEEEVTIQTDASNKGLGAVLLQNGQPVAFASRTLSPTEQRYATIEKEYLVIVFACERFNQYLARREQISVETDHKPFESIFKSLLSAPCRLQRVLLKLQRFNSTVNYKPGSQMLLADHLSRAAQHETSEPEESFQVFSLGLESLDPMQTLKVTPERLDQLQRSTSHDDTLLTLKTTILIGWPMQKDQHHKSNGKAESAVKIVKSLFRKALKDSKDPWLALLDQRNTPTESMESSPEQRLMSKRIRSLLPTASNLLFPKIPENVNAKLKLKRQNAKWYHDRTSRTLPELHVGQEVRVAPLQRNQSWKTGTYIKKLSDRSYVVKTSSDNQVFRRNREFLKPATRPAEQPKPVESSDSQLKKSVSQPSKQAVKSANHGPKPTMTSQTVSLKKTRTRVVKPPSRFNDFVA
ncbi:Retrovirus-related Pol polyprotein from transposon 17.6 [Stylophora pistillata]|uniref:Retrovirus-related Pol polyprotein from transposon 17.6 n=1 Tax=Stylophora pistillata TaxID=50429 RepID=A0A2B4SGA5_STYPI|nr:Retrovirus-related Pol polyprotein from transposon 17.6 [Stylophora pistillata]